MNKDWDFYWKIQYRLVRIFFPGEFYAKGLCTQRSISLYLVSFQVTGTGQRKIILLPG